MQKSPHLLRDEGYARGTTLVARHELCLTASITCNGVSRDFLPHSSEDHLLGPLHRQSCTGSHLLRLAWTKAGDYSPNHRNVVLKFFIIITNLREKSTARF